MYISKIRIYKKIQYLEIVKKEKHDNKDIVNHHHV